MPAGGKSQVAGIQTDPKQLRLNHNKGRAATDLGIKVNYVLWEQTHARYSVLPASQQASQNRFPGHFSDQCVQPYNLVRGGN